MRGQHVETELTDYGLTVIHIPAALGKWFNSCDQAINSVFRNNYDERKRSNPFSPKIANIISAYYSISEETAAHSAQRTGLFGGDAHTIVKARLSEGYDPPTKRRGDKIRYDEAFDQWCEMSLRSQEDMLPSHSPSILHSTTTTGRYWGEYGYGTRGLRSKGKKKK